MKTTVTLQKIYAAVVSVSRIMCHGQGWGNHNQLQILKYKCNHSHKSNNSIVIDYLSLIIISYDYSTNCTHLIYLKYNLWHFFNL